jgi:hypothetical protein
LERTLTAAPILVFVSKSIQQNMQRILEKDSRERLEYCKSCSRINVCGIVNFEDFTSFVVCVIIFLCVSSSTHSQPFLVYFCETAQILIL